MNKFLTSNTPGMRLARTILQAIIGVIVSYADNIIGLFVISEEARPIIVALVMAVLSPIMAMLGEKTETGDQ